LEPHPSGKALKRPPQNFPKVRTETLFGEIDRTSGIARSPVH
jgi:hypothetical protein